VFLVVSDVPVKFLLPPFGSCFRGGGSFATFMSVPEAAVDEDNGLVFAQDDIGFTRQIFAMQAEAVAGAVEHGADEEFGLCILSANLAHQLRALFWCQTIHNRDLTTEYTEYTENVSRGDSRESRGEAGLSSLRYLCVIRTRAE